MNIYFFKVVIKDENFFVVLEYEFLVVFYKYLLLYKVKMIGDINLLIFEFGSKFMIVDYGGRIFV